MRDDRELFIQRDVYENGGNLFYDLVRVFLKRWRKKYEKTGQNGEFQPAIFRVLNRNVKQSTAASDKEKHKTPSSEQNQSLLGTTR
jgi:hypothetical protein